MIQLPTKSDLQTLKEWRNPDSVTIYSPYIEPSSSASNPNKIQLKVLLKEARQLLSKQLDQREIDKLLQPADKLIDTDEFTTSSKHGLVLFISHDFFSFYHLPPEGIRSGVIVDKQFKVQPVIELKNDNLSYYVLMVSYNGAQLFKGDRYHIKKLKFQKHPTTMMLDLNIDELPNERQLHAVGPVSSGRNSEKYHGQYNETQVNKDLLVKFFRNIDRRLHNVIKNKNAPLILAGVEYLLPLYRQVNTYPHLSTKELRGSLEHTPIDTIRERACALL